MGCRSSLIGARCLQKGRPIRNVQYEKREREEKARKLIDAQCRLAPIAERIVLGEVRRAVVFIESVLVEIDRLGEVLIRVAFHGLGRYRAHVVVDYGEFHQREKNEHRTGRHPHVDGLDVRNGR